MSIFFNETVFIKDDCDLEKDITSLESLKGKVENEEELNKQIQFLKAGLSGEKAIEYELKNANIGMFVLHDVNVFINDLKAQIDYIIITPVHCYIVECKNMVGDITVDNNGQFIRKLPWGKKESIYSPITQVQRHLDIIKKHRDSNRSTLLNVLGAVMGVDSYYKPLVVAANTNGILDIKRAPKEIKSKIVKVDELITYLKKDVENTPLSNRDSKNTMKNMADYFLSINTPKEENWTQKFILKGDNNDLETNLKDYRTKQSKERNYPAYYIFTNKELDDLLRLKPRTIDELKGILEPIKVRMYGEDIIEITNKY